MKYKNRFFQNVELNNKGQAASTDALLFLAIVGIVFTLIIGYSMSYGLNIMNSAKKLYNNNFHYSALKTFMNASFGRDAQNLLNTKVSDSVATMIKEDYGASTLIKANDPVNFSDANLISNDTKLAMFGLLDQIFLPMPQRSYLLLITHNVSDQISAPVKRPLIVLIKYFDELELKHIYLVCNPGDNSWVETYLQNHPLDLEIVEGNFILYKNVLSKETDSDKKIAKVDGSIYLSSWLSSYTEEEISEYCVDYTELVNERIYPSS